MANSNQELERDRQRLAAAAQQGSLAKLRTYFALSGPGWIASAITLGAGSLASSLYLGVLGGYSLLWLQPFAMVLGVIMLGAIGYVTLSSGERPFRAINQHVSPVLGWGWALAVAAANVIWCMPQHSLAFAVLSQNLAPEFLSPDGPVAGFAATRLSGAPAWLTDHFPELSVSLVILVVATVVTWGYDRGGWGLRLYEGLLKIVVGLIVLSFFAVVGLLTFSDQPLAWKDVASGLVPDFRQFLQPAATFAPYLEAIGELGSPARDFWQQKIVDEQRDVMISAVATAVGINMTFMFPYTLLRKGWTKEFRGLSVFDLATGMFIPFVLATSCVVIAAAARFHTELPAGFSLEERGGQEVLLVDEASGKYGAFRGLLSERDTKLAVDAANQPLPASTAEQKVAAMLVRRDAIDLAQSLAPLGSRVANYIFGFGVLAMVLSTISILMLISGFVFAEMMAYPPAGKVHKLGTLVAGIGGALWPLFWRGDSQVYLAVVTSVFGFMLLPFAYVTFVFLLNSRSLLGSEFPRGWRRLLANVLTLIAALAATVGAVYMIWVKARYMGLVAISLFVALALMVAINQRNEARFARVDNSSGEGDP